MYIVQTGFGLKYFDVVREDSVESIFQSPGAASGSLESRKAENPGRQIVDGGRFESDEPLSGLDQKFV